MIEKIQPRGPMSQTNTDAVLATANLLHETMQKAQQDMEEKHYHGRSQDIALTLNGRYQMVSIQISEDIKKQSVEQISQHIHAAFQQALDEIRDAASKHLTALSQEFSNQLSDKST